MRKIALAVIGILAVGIPLFAAGGGQQGARAGADGLTTVRVWGGNGQRTIGQDRVGLADWYNGTLPSRYWDQMTAEMAKRGIKLELDLVEGDQIAIVFQTLLASGRLNDYDWLDAGVVDERSRLPLINQGRIYQLDKAIQQYSDGPARDFYFNDPVGISYIKHTALEDGTVWWLTNGSTDYYKTPENYISAAPTSSIRKDWLDKAGLSFPPKTLDDFYNALVAFRQNDVNGNGIQDEVADARIDDFWNGIAQWFGLGPQLISSIDGKAVSPWYQAHARDYFAYMNRLYRAGLLRIQGAGNDMAANKVAYGLLWLHDYWSESSTTVPEGAAKPYYAPFLIQPYADAPARIRTQDGVAIYAPCFYIIPSGSKNVEKVIKMVDYFVSNDYFILSEYGIEGYSFEYGSDGKLIKLPRSDAMAGKDFDIRPALWINAIFPRFQRGDAAEEQDTLKLMADEMGYPDGFKLKADFAEDYFARKYALAYNIDAQMAFPTAREMERIAAILPDLNTYSTELMSSLIIGTKSLDNWNSYMDDLKRLGLDELITIYTARMERAK